MRLTILKDEKITTKEMDKLQKEFTALFPIEPTFFTHNRDYNVYPTYTDKDGHRRPTSLFLTEETDWVHKKYGKWGTDHVFILIHEDNWLSKQLGNNGKSIWGTNYSNIYHGYQVHYCRFDKDNSANSLGTFYHEAMHSLDSLVATETGIDIASLIPVDNWDRSVVHGQHQKYDYIRYNENIEVVEYIKPYLLKAYANRQARFDKNIAGMKQVVQLLTTLVALLRLQFNRKNGVNKQICLNHNH